MELKNVYFLLLDLWQDTGNNSRALGDPPTCGSIANSSTMKSPTGWPCMQRKSPDVSYGLRAAWTLNAPCPHDTVPLQRESERSLSTALSSLSVTWELISSWAFYEETPHNYLAWWSRTVTLLQSLWTSLHFLILLQRLPMRILRRSKIKQNAFWFIMLFTMSYEEQWL